MRCRFHAASTLVARDYAPAAGLVSRAWGTTRPASDVMKRPNKYHGRLPLGESPAKPGARCHAMNQIPLPQSSECCPEYRSVLLRARGVTSRPSVVVFRERLELPVTVRGRHRHYTVPCPHRGSVDDMYRAIPPSSTRAATSRASRPGRFYSSSCNGRPYQLLTSI